MAEAGIPRSETLLWNTGPGWDEDIANSARTARRDAHLLNGVLGLLPRMQVEVLVGGVARMGHPNTGNVKPSATLQTTPDHSRPRNPME